MTSADPSLSLSTFARCGTTRMFGKCERGSPLHLSLSSASSGDLRARAPTPGVRVPPSPAAAFSPPGLTSRPPANPTLSLRRPFSFLNMSQWPVLPPHSPMPTAPSTVLPTPPHPCRPTCRSVLRGLPRSTPHREIGHSLQIHLRHHPECYAHPLCLRPDSPGSPTSQAAA